MNTLWDSVKAEKLLGHSFLRARGSSIRVLRGLLRQSSQTSFGSEHCLHPEMTFEEFRAAVPIRGYKDYEPWINRVQLGESSVLWPGRPSYFASTSGTTSTNKLIPITSDFLRDYHLGSLISVHRMLFRKPASLSGRILTLGGPSEEGRLGDIPVGSITGILYETLPRALASKLVVPTQVHNIGAYEEKLYVLSRFALEAQISGIITMIPGSLLVLRDAINRMATQLISEIAAGLMRPLQSGSKSLEEELKAHLKPNPNRANELHNMLVRDGRLVAKRIWPIRGICAYRKQAPPSQWSAIHEEYGEVTVIDPGLVSTEGRVSVGIFPNSDYHAVAPVSSFIELSPLGADLKEKQNVPTLLPDEARSGECYSPVISSANGLLRYRLGDVIRVERMMRGIPVVEYVGRLDNSLSVAGEKVCEAHFREAVETLRQRGYLIEALWSVSIGWEEHTPFYHFTWETNEPCAELAEAFDDVLQQLNVSYQRKRRQMLLSPLRTTYVALGKMLTEGDDLHWIGQSKPRYLIANSDFTLNSLSHDSSL